MRRLEDDGKNGKDGKDELTHEHIHELTHAARNP